MRDDVEGFLVPVIEVSEFKRYLSRGFGNLSFKLGMSLKGNSYKLECYYSGKLAGMAEIPLWNNVFNRKTYVILHSVNITGEEKAFESLFHDILGKMIGKATIASMYDHLKGQGLDGEKKDG